MLSQPSKKHIKCFASSAIILALVGVFMTRTASARRILNTIDPVAIVTDNGRHLIVTGPIGCTLGQRELIRVTVTQRRLTVTQHEIGAVAEGHTRVICTGKTQKWEVHAWTQSKETFEEGAATAVALGRQIKRSRERSHVTDAHQWLVNITLEEE